MPGSTPLVTEEVHDLAAHGPDLSAGTRSARCFFRPPASGVTPSTGVLVSLHGLGGRHNDISYKRTRARLADAHDLLCVGVNYLGTDVYSRDLAFVTAQVEPAIRELYTDELHAELLTKGDPHMQVVKVSPDYLRLIESPLAAAECAKPLADDFWDFGAIQALDVLGALAWLRQRLQDAGVAFDGRPIHLLSQSAGGQTAAMLIKFAPKSFASWLDLGGVLLAGPNAAALPALLSDQCGWFHPGTARDSVFHPDNTPAFSMAFRSPVGFGAGSSRAARGGSVPDLADECALRDTGRLDHYLPPGASSPAVSTIIRSLHGAADDTQPLAVKQDVLRVLATAGADVAVRPITKADVDGVVVKQDGHLFVGDVTTLAERVGPSMWQRFRSTTMPPSDIGSNQQYQYPAPHGSWHLRHSDTGASLSFRPQ